MDERELQVKRITNAQHAMQSGVAYEMELSNRHQATEPKHLRVGINNALVEVSALAKLFIDKGLISELEYLGALANAYEEEQHRYEKRNGCSFA